MSSDLSCARALKARRLALAGALHAHGLRPGDVVAVQIPNWLEGALAVQAQLLQRRPRHFRARLDRLFARFGERAALFHAQAALRAPALRMLRSDVARRAEVHQMDRYTGMKALALVAPRDDAEAIAALARALRESFDALRESIEDAAATVPAMFDHLDHYEHWSEHGYEIPQPNGDIRHLTDLTGDKAIAYLQSCREPFCLSISFNAPHAQDAAPRQYICHLYTSDAADE